MRFVTVSIYFILVIVGFASVGIFLPYCFETMDNQPHNMESLNQNIITYFVAILASASLDLVLKLIDSNNSGRKIHILLIALLNFGVLIMTCYILYINATDINPTVSNLTLLGVILSWGIWWIANYRNSSFDSTTPIASLGGNANNPLQNGP